MCAYYYYYYLLRASLGSFHVIDQTVGHRRPRPRGSLARPSPRQPTAMRLRIQQGVCCSCGLSKTAFTPLVCALVRPHLEYAMESNVPTLRPNIKQLERAQRLATRLVRGLRHVPYEERLRQFNLFSMEGRRLPADLSLAFKMFKGKVDLNPFEFFLRPPRAGLRRHTYRIL